MLKKSRVILCLFLCITFLFGCTETEVGMNKDAKSMAKDIVKTLKLSDDLKEVEDELLPGLIFFEDDLIISHGFYISERGADTVGVFRTDNPELTKKYINAYLKSLKQQLENNNPAEVFKVDNAILEANDTLVVVIICDDLEEGKRICHRALEP